MKKRNSNLRALLTLFLAFTMPFLSACGVPSGKESQGEAFTELSDDDLFETVYFQLLDVVDAFPDEQTALANMSPQQKTVYILSIYDMEIQNGGLCQFFVNSSRSLAPYIEDHLGIIGATEHKKLFADFIEKNSIVVHDLDSFIVSDVREYVAQVQRYDFGSFDEQYAQLPALESDITAYIRANIEAF